MFFTLSLLVTTSKPCDIYKAAGTPCVAAHSTVRALSDSFHGPLYEIMSMKNGTTTLIHTLSPGGLADAAAQDAFCGAAACTISRILDQSGNANHLSTAPGGGEHGAADNGVNATALKIALGSHNVYGVYSEHGSGPGRAHSGTGYRCDKTTGIAKGDEPETIYMVTAGKRFNSGCCFDYGNAETDNHADGAGSMEAVYFGNASAPGWSKGVGQGPWVMADLESGVWAGNVVPVDITESNTPVVRVFIYRHEQPVLIQF